MELPVVPYGSWPSPLTAAAVVAGAATPGEVRADGDDVWWSEARPGEGGRVQIVRHTPDAERHDVLPDGWSARTRVHEYGGGAWCVRGAVLVFVRDEDQRIYRLDPELGAVPRPLTPTPVGRHGLRYADLAFDAGGCHVLAVREAHGADRSAVATGDEPVNDLIAVAVDGSAATSVSLPALVEGADFFARPCTGPSDRALAWISWDHPAMPWDATVLRVAPLRHVDGAPQVDLSAAEVVAGHAMGEEGESVTEPAWLPDGSLTFLSDRSGWWNPYRWRAGTVEQLATVAGEIGGPHWVFGLTSLAWTRTDRFVCSVRRDGDATLAVGTSGGGAPDSLELPFSEVTQVVSASGGSVLVVGGGPTSESTVARVLLASNAPRAHVEVLRPARDVGFGADTDAWVSTAEHITVPTTDGMVTHALLYRPRNPTVRAPQGTRPPLLVLCHGGPTSHARNQLSVAVQFWTSRGFCVADVNYRGSTGYGRTYRDALRGAWGVRDVADCVAVAQHLAASGEVDGTRMAIRGGSAGGFVVLAALTFHDTFAAGTSLYGIGDLEALARDTHKFEARYLDGLVAPWPQGADVYRARSPIHHLDQVRVPVAIFQGAEDQVVPAAQAEAIVAALAANGVPYAAVTFAGEQHGFRQAPNIIRALEGELWFYGRVFGFEPADDIDPLPGSGL